MNNPSPTPESLENAFARFHNGEVEQADQAAEAILAQTPDQPWAWHLRAMVAFRQGDNEGARDFWSRALEAGQAATFLTGRGRARFALGEYAGAVADLEASTRLDGEGPWVWLHLGRAYRAVGRFAEAVAAFQRALGAQESARWRVDIGQTHLIARRPAEALAALDEALAVEPELPGARALRGLALVQLGRLDEAEREIAAVREAAPNSGPAWAATAALALRRRRFDEAEEAAERAIQAAPQFPESYVYRAQVRLRGEELQKALADVDQALARRPAFPMASAVRGAVLRRLGRLEEAAAAYRQALEGAPGAYDIRLNLANVLADQEALVEAEAAFREVTREAPALVEAWRNLSGVLARLHRLEEAEAAARSAVEAGPSDPASRRQLSRILAQRERLEEAESVAREAVALDPEDAASHRRLGAVLAEHDRLTEAESALQEAVRLAPEDPANHRQLAGLLSQLERWPEAEEAARDSVRFGTEDPESHILLGEILSQRGKEEEADYENRRAIYLQPRNPEHINKVGLTYQREGRFDEAERLFRQALEIDPEMAESMVNLASVLQNKGDNRQAMDLLQKALEIRPEFAEANNNLGNLYKEVGRFEDAVAAFDAALALRPDHPHAMNNRAETLKGQGRLDEALEGFRKSIELKPDFAMGHSNLVMALHYHPAYSKQAIFDEHLRWHDQHIKPLALAPKAYPNDRDPERRLRVGFISPSFRRHPVGYMTIAALEHMDPERFELYGYNNTGKTDDLTERFEAAFHQWESVNGLSDDAVAERIEADQLDILVDLAGHSMGNRLRAFARRPAPVQVKWVGGQFNTTGMTEMDYFLTDWRETPEGEEVWYTESVVRMPDGYVCYDPPHYAPDVTPLPAKKRGEVIFGCFNNVAKVNPEILELWRQILERVPSSKLVMKSPALGDEATKERFKDDFRAVGGDPDRMILAGASPHPKLLAQYQKVDIALDPYPYSGGLTTCEAMWMGVPVVTRPGPTFAGRHSATHLTNAGLGDWVTDTPEAYVEKAVEWANRLDDLAALRARLRDQVAASPLCDGPRFARHLEQAFRTMWRTYAAGEAPHSFAVAPIEAGAEVQPGTASS